MQRSQIFSSKEQSGIDEWGAGYFTIDESGRVVCTPLGPQGGEVPLLSVVAKAKVLGVRTPMLVRFPQVIQGQLQRMHSAFESAISEFSYGAKHLGVFPFKVNQRREFIDAIVARGQEMNWGLEVGSKTEFMAALSYQLNQEALLICNGFKDVEFIEMAFVAAAIGRRVLLVVEGPDELQEIISRSKKFSLSERALKVPQIGLRIRLYSKGSGKWERSSGESSKFGLTTVELMETLALIEDAKLQDRLSMLHFHIGSQITAIKRFKNALREAARVYSKIRKMGFAPSYLNIGGGVGVDYDGSQTSSQSSANYTLQQFANDAVYVIGEVCRNEQVPCPDIVTESGRVIAAYHSVVITDIREVQGEESFELSRYPGSSSGEENHRNVNELRYIYKNLSAKNANEFYHDALGLNEDLFTLFNLGYISLKERAIAEDLFSKICQKVLQFSAAQKHIPDEIEKLQKQKVSKYLANFSIFQSMPDSWSIDQLFPVIPLSRHGEKPSTRATIVDITCDSDGCLDRFIDRKEEKNTLDLHIPDGSPYYLGFFLVGAYQESLANEHNLFGAIHEVEVVLEKAGSWHISKTTAGDNIRELLVARNYDAQEMLANYKIQIHKAAELGAIHSDETPALLEKLESYLDSYPYLVEKIDPIMEVG